MAEEKEKARDPKLVQFEKKYHLDDWYALVQRQPMNGLWRARPTVLESLRFNISNFVITKVRANAYRLVIRFAVTKADWEHVNTDPETGKRYRDNWSWYPSDLSLYVRDQPSCWIHSLANRAELDAIYAEFPR